MNELSHDTFGLSHLSMRQGRPLLLARFAVTAQHCSDRRACLRGAHDGSGSWHLCGDCRSVRIEDKYKAARNIPCNSTNLIREDVGASTWIEVTNALLGERAAAVKNE